MSKGKNVLTTGQVAKICNVAPRTVSKWFDRGQLKGYRIPGSKDRRIPVSELQRFMKEHNMPLVQVPFGKTRVLIADSDIEQASALAQTLRAGADYEVQMVQSTFETALTASNFAPHVILVNLLAHDICADEICKNIRSNEELQTIKVIAMARNLGDYEAKALLGKGFDGCISDTSDPVEMVKKIEQTTAIVY